MAAPSTGARPPATTAPPGNSPGPRCEPGNRFDRFRTELSSLRDAEVKRVALVNRTAGVDHCSGTLRTVRSDDGRWLVDPAGVQCTAS